MILWNIVQNNKDKVCDLYSAVGDKVRDLDCVQALNVCVSLNLRKSFSKIVPVFRLNGVLLTIFLKFWQTWDSIC